MSKKITHGCHWCLWLEWKLRNEGLYDGENEEREINKVCVRGGCCKIGQFNRRNPCLQLQMKGA